MKTKEEIREEIKRKLKGQLPEIRSEQSRKIHSRLYDLDVFKASSSLLIYLSMPEEVDTLAIVKQCFVLKKRVIAPKVNLKTNELELRIIKNLDQDIQMGRWGILEPHEQHTRQAQLHDIDCAILPGIAFDRKGNRLGRGKGFFDRLLSSASKPFPRIALAYLFQIQFEIPMMPGDQAVDIVLSPHEKLIFPL